MNGSGAAMAFTPGGSPSRESSLRTRSAFSSATARGHGNWPDSRRGYLLQSQRFAGHLRYALGARGQPEILRSRIASHARTRSRFGPQPLHRLERDDVSVRSRSGYFHRHAGSSYPPTGTIQPPPNNSPGASDARNTAPRSAAAFPAAA